MIQATKLEPLQNRLGEVRDKLSAAASACRAASTHRSDTAKKLARFLESILPRDIQQPPPAATPVYTNGTIAMPPQQMLHHQDQQNMISYSVQPSSGYTPSSGFDFSGMGNLFDHNM